MLCMKCNHKNILLKKLKALLTILLALSAFWSSAQPFFSGINREKQLPVTISTKGCQSLAV